MNFNKLVVNPIIASLSRNTNRNAFYIDGKFYSYLKLKQCVSKIRTALRNINDQYIGLVANDDLETYASILALWIEGKCYVPLHPLQPIDRCKDIISQVGIGVVLDSSTFSRYENMKVIYTKNLQLCERRIGIQPQYSDDDMAYILFTSGTTGRPKGVPISRGNVAAFVESFKNLGIKIKYDDRCLQMFDLTFDLSVQSYLLPLLNGACVYTVPPDSIKYQAAFELLDDHHLTMALMVPSVIHYLRPYMNEINIASLKYSLFAGEALNNEDTECWSKSVPFADIWNVYGPTEDTIYCTAYRFNRDKANKQVNGTLSIGKTMYGVTAIVVDEKLQPCFCGEKGELCLAGNQLTPGYWKDDAKNKESFFVHDGLRYYKTGDICSIDDDGDISYYGRKDSQIKIQGYRIELSEIEHVAREFYDERNAVVALPIYDKSRNCSIHLVVEDNDESTEKPLMNRLKKYLPAYMLPSHIHFMKQFPMNRNSKTDRKKIAETILK
jgi:D-alanine--poly(phosphoribitol) ligase subunit 1